MSRLCYNLAQAGQFFMSEGEYSNIGVVMFAVGLTLMMALDVALG